GIAAVAGRIRERPDDLHELRHRPGPAVRDDQRERRGPDTPRVDEVNAEPVDVGAELREGIEPRFRGSAVVAVAPVRDEVAEVREVRAVGPAPAGDLVGEAGAGEALAEA